MRTIAASEPQLAAEGTDANDLAVRLQPQKMPSNTSPPQTVVPRTQTLQADPGKASSISSLLDGCHGPRAKLRGMMHLNGAG